MGQCVYGMPSAVILLTIYAGHHGEVRSATFSPDGRRDRDCLQRQHRSRLGRTHPIPEATDRVDRGGSIRPIVERRQGRVGFICERPVRLQRHALNSPTRWPSWVSRPMTTPIVLKHRRREMRICWKHFACSRLQPRRLRASTGQTIPGENGATVALRWLVCSRGLA